MFKSKFVRDSFQDVLWFLESCKIAAPESVVKDINQTINCYQPQYCQHVENKEGGISLSLHFSQFPSTGSNVTPNLLKSCATIQTMHWKRSLTSTGARVENIALAAGRK